MLADAKATILWSQMSNAHVFTVQHLQALVVGMLADAKLEVREMAATTLSGGQSNCQTCLFWTYVVFSVLPSWKCGKWRPPRSQVGSFILQHYCNVVARLFPLRRVERSAGDGGRHSLVRVISWVNPTHAVLSVCGPLSCIYFLQACSATHDVSCRTAEGPAIQRGSRPARALHPPEPRAVSIGQAAAHGRRRGGGRGGGGCRWVKGVLEERRRLALHLWFEHCICTFRFQTCQLAPSVLMQGRKAPAWRSATLCCTSYKISTNFLRFYCCRGGGRQPGAAPLCAVQVTKSAQISCASTAAGEEGASLAQRHSVLYKLQNQHNFLRFYCCRGGGRQPGAVLRSVLQCSSRIGF